jgi:hypothetical protein
MKRLFVGLAALALAASIPSAQEQGQPPAAPTNLQVLPKDLGGPQVVQIMQAFNGALGVQCAYCHVTAVGPGTMNDFASDMKPQKKTARVMMLMARDVNAKLGIELGKPASEVTPVQCVTCHRGLPIPNASLPPAPAAPSAP